MGGNVKVDGYSAVPIECTAENLKQIQFDIINWMFSLNQQFFTFSGGKLLFTSAINLDVFTGSSVHLFDPAISVHELLTHKSAFGDIDLQTHYNLKYVLEDFLKTYPVIGAYTVRAWSKHGNEISVLQQHENGQVHQFDFQLVDEPGSVYEQFLHSAAWVDIRAGFKGAHHKLLLNAVGLDKWKFSIVRGLSSRTDDRISMKAPMRVQTCLFGDISRIDVTSIYSFTGVVNMISKFTPQANHEAIVKKFEESCTARVVDSEANARAIAFIKETLNV